MKNENYIYVQNWNVSLQLFSIYWQNTTDGEAQFLDPFVGEFWKHFSCGLDTACDLLLAGKSRYLWKRTKQLIREIKTKSKVKGLARGRGASFTHICRRVNSCHRKCSWKRIIVTHFARGEQNRGESIPKYYLGGLLKTKDYEGEKGIVLTSGMRNPIICPPPLPESTPRRTDARNKGARGQEGGALKQYTYTFPRLHRCHSRVIRYTFDQNFDYIFSRRKKNWTLKNC